MADGISAKLDTTGWDRGLDQLSDFLRERLARSMAVAGGQVLRDEAKARAPVGTAEGGSITPGLLRSAIYLAYSPERSTDGKQVYVVSWNSEKARHGHLLEFGHWLTHVAYRGPDGEWYSNPDKPLAQPKWVAAEPFLRPALDASIGRARDAMIVRGRQRLFDLLAGQTEDIEA